MKLQDFSQDKTVRVGFFGSAFAAICCFTPILVILFGAVGLITAAQYLDYVLYPALGFFLLVLLYGVTRKYCVCKVKLSK